MSDLITYSEIFRSIQGEGKHTGRPTLWVRLFGCNLQCGGFGQADPTDPSSYVLPFKDFDISSVSKLEDLPVWKYGCDSSYSWSKKYKHLCHQETAAQIVDKLIELGLSTSSNFHLCFTGGEPLMPFNQKAIIQILDVLTERKIWGIDITFETNGTQKLSEELEEKLLRFATRPEQILFSVSPKLFTVSGEKNEKAIIPENLVDYRGNWWDDHNPFDMQVKFVLGDEDRQWDELDSIILDFNRVLGFFDIWIMPVSGTVEGQQEIAARVADRAIARGYSVAARVHCYLFGNSLGT